PMLRGSRFDSGQMEARTREQFEAAIARAGFLPHGAFRGRRLRPIPLFELSDPEGGLCTLEEEVEDLVVEVIGPGAPIAQEVHRDSRGTTLANPSHYRGSPEWRQAGGPCLDGPISGRAGSGPCRSRPGAPAARCGSARATGPAAAPPARADRSRSAGGGRPGAPSPRTRA